MRRRDRKSCKRDVASNYIILLTAFCKRITALIKLLDALLDRLPDAIGCDGRYFEQTGIQISE